MSERVTGLGPGSEVVDAAKGPLLPVAFEDLVAWYPFRSGTGEDLTAGDGRFGDTTDYSAVVNGATFKPSGGVTDIKTGANSGAFEFDGIDDELDAGAAQGLVPQSLTLIAVTKADVTKSSMRVVHTRKPNIGGYTLTNDGDSVSFAVFSGGNFENGFISANTQGKFVTLAGSFDSGTVRMNLNGGQQIDTAQASYGTSSFSPFEIAPQGPGGSPRFDGTIDEVRLYSPALSQSQINQIHNNINP
jgi:hypothetical protein